MDAGQTATHTFSIRNEGAGILRLVAGRSTCQCTKFEVETEEVPPGKTGRVKLHWQTAEAGEPFHHGAIVRTNDPDRKEIMLRIKGEVKTFMASSPGGVVFSTVRPGEHPHNRVVVYSQIWDKFEVAKVESEFKHVTWKVTAASPDELKKLDATAGYGLDFELAPDLPHGQFHGKLMVHTKVVQSDGSQTELPPLKVHVLGNRVGNASFMGPIVDSDGFLDIGLVEQGQAVHHTVHLFLRGGEDICIEKIESDPKFLDVKAEPAAGAPAGQTRYRLEIDVPRSASMANYIRDMGFIRLVTNSKTDPVVQVKVKMAVVAAD